jgi:hypothetical protein
MSRCAVILPAVRSVWPSENFSRVADWASYPLESCAKRCDSPLCAQRFHLSRRRAMQGCFRFPSPVANLKRWLSSQNYANRSSSAVFVPPSIPLAINARAMPQSAPAREVCRKDPEPAPRPHCMPTDLPETSSKIYPAWGNSAFLLNKVGALPGCGEAPPISCTTPTSSP